MQFRDPQRNIKIIDVSRYQGQIDWTAVAASGVRGVFIKATEGLGYKDPMLYENAWGAYEAGLKVGYYHYARPETGNTAAAEVQALMTALLGLPVSLPLVLDVEGEAADLGPAKLTEWAYEWLSEAQRRHQHQGSVMLYTGASFARSYLGQQLAEFPLWVAHYGTDTPMSNNTWSNWAVFQYTDKGSVPGIVGNVDVNEMDLGFWNEVTQTEEGEVDMPLKLEDWQWKMLYEVMGKAYNVDQLQWDWMQKIVDKTLTASELAFLNTVLDGRIDRKLEV